MTGFTLLIELTPKGQLHFDSCQIDQGGTEMERVFLASIRAAVSSCIETLDEHYQSGIPISHDAVSQKALAVFQSSLEEYIRSRNSMN